MRCLNTDEGDPGHGANSSKAPNHIDRRGRSRPPPPHGDAAMRVVFHGVTSDVTATTARSPVLAPATAATSSAQGDRIGPIGPQKAPLCLRGWAGCAGGPRRGSGVVHSPQAQGNLIFPCHPKVAPCLSDRGKTATCIRPDRAERGDPWPVDHHGSPPRRECVLVSALLANCPRAL
jgi:hypothetical protein